MKEIRLHGRGGQGVVKASQLIVKAAVKGGRYGQFIPFFGVERKGSPVFGYLRLSETPIRRKMQSAPPKSISTAKDQDQQENNNLFSTLHSAITLPSVREISMGSPQPLPRSAFARISSRSASSGTSLSLI